MKRVELKYRTLAELLGEVSIDFHVLSSEGMIEPAQLIKIAQKITYDLGLKVHATKHALLDVVNNKAKLPDDFYVLNSALVCGNYRKCLYTESLTREDVPLGNIGCSKCAQNLDEPCSKPDPICICNKVYTNDCRDSFKVVKKVGLDVYEFTEFEQIRFRKGRGVDSSCFNARIAAQNTGEIKNGFLHTSIKNGKIYISYEGALEDEDGNLLVLDHPMINEYYEYAIKSRILENMYYNGEDVVQKIQFTEERLRQARTMALGIVGTPDFAELQSVWENNRRFMFNRYYRMFT